MTRLLIGLSGMFVGIWVLIGWAHWRYWVWLAEREKKQ